MLIIIFIIFYYFLLFYCLYIYIYLNLNKKYKYEINYNTLNIITRFFNYKTRNLINIITLFGNNIKDKYKYIKYIAKLYNKKVINCNLHKLHNTNDIKELFFHKRKFAINKKHF